MKWCGFINKYPAMQVLFGHGVKCFAGLYREFRLFFIILQL